jgi:arylsulfatase A-like enzyme
MRGDLSRRAFMGTVASGVAASSVAQGRKPGTMAKQPNIVYIMTDQQRADTIAALGNRHVYTPNFDRLVQRGVSFTNAYSSCPVCVPARYTIRTGRQEPITGIYQNGRPNLVDGQPKDMEERCGAYLPRTLQSLGYQTFGVGKFHTAPWDETLGYDTHLHSEELYGNQKQRQNDDYAAFIAKEHPELDWVEGLMGERTEMYYMPQMSTQPAASTVEGWAASRTVEAIRGADSERPYFSFTSFVGPHPPFAPPIPFNRMYDPDRMPNPVRGAIEIDHMDEQIPWMNHIIWAEDINDSHARVLKSRYYGEISYIDHCLGRILDAVEARDDADNTLICFFADHGDHLGDHHAWQKESYFEASCHIPFLLSWPAQLPENARNTELVCLTDLFGIASTAAGVQDLRDGHDVLGMLRGSAQAREHVIGYYGVPGTERFKIMVRRGDWKYIYFANGGREQLFNITEDPDELTQRIDSEPAAVSAMREVALAAATGPNVNRALDGNGFKSFELTPGKRFRIHQFDRSRGVTGFPENPGDVLKDWGWE